MFPCLLTSLNALPRSPLYSCLSWAGNDARRRSPAHSRTPGGSGGDVGNEPPSTELVGKAAEARGLWLAALRATVCTVRCASHFVPPFVQDFESAGGYETVAYMVRQSSIERLPAMLEQVRCELNKY